MLLFFQMEARMVVKKKLTAVLICVCVLIGFCCDSFGDSDVADPFIEEVILPEETTPASDKEVTPPDIWVDESPSDTTQPEEEVLPGDGGVEDGLSERIEEIAQDAMSEELGYGFDVSYTFGYIGQGVDDVLPEHFFRGHIVSQEVSISHSIGFRLAVKNLTSIDGGLFSDLGDRTVLGVDVRRHFGSLYGTIKHQWVHTNYQMDKFFFYADRHRTTLQAGGSFGGLHPFLFVTSDLPAYTPVHEAFVFGGMGVDLDIPIDRLNTKIDFGASVAGSLFWYYQKPRTLLRTHIGFVTDFGSVSFGPRFNYIYDPFGHVSINWVNLDLIF